MTHMSTHNTEENACAKYACTVCDKKFNRKSNLKDHMITHSDVKPFSCETCQKRFTNASNLTKHKQLHENIKKFSCIVESCNYKKFSQKIHLQKHMLRIHGIKEIKRRVEVILKPIILSNELIVKAAETFS